MVGSHLLKSSFDYQDYVRNQKIAKEKSLDLGFKNFTKFFVPYTIVNPSNLSNFMLVKKV